MFGKNILLLVPHPDDEVVACAATLGRAQAMGAKIFALYLTHGCLARETLWPWQRQRYEHYVNRRRTEAERVAQNLKIEPAGWSPRPARHLWRELPQVQAEIKAAIEGYAIDQIWTPAYEGGNPDHDALNAVCQRFMPQLSVLEFAEYNFYQRRAQAQTFPHPNGQEEIVRLTDAERQQKKALLKLYASEQKNLNYIGLVRECYRPLAPRDYRQPPHSGTLWYTRFQWVPFRHPRVDFTKPWEVSAAITAFLSAAP